MMKPRKRRGGLAGVPGTAGTAAGPGPARLAGVVGIAAVLLCLCPAPAMAEAGTGIFVNNIKTEPGKLSFVLTGPGLPDVAAIPADGIAVSVAGQRLETQFKTGRSMERSELPVRGVVVVLDTGAEMVGAPLAATEVALFDYIDRLSPDISAGLVATSDTTKAAVPLAYDRAAVRVVAGVLTAAGSSTLNDAIVLATKQFDATYTERRIVVLTDGPEKDSKASMPEVTAALADQRVALDVISYGPAETADLVKLATASSGTAIKAETREDLQRAVATLVATMPAPIAVTAAVPAALSGRSATLDIGVASGAKTVTATTPVSFAVDPRAVPPLDTIRLKTLPTIILYAGVGLLGLALMVIVFGVVYSLLGRAALQERRRQLDRISGKRTASTGKDDQASSQVMKAALAVSERAVTRQGRATIETELERAAIALRPAEWYLVRAGVAIGLAAVLMLFLPWWFVELPVGLGLGWYVTGWYRKHRAARRARKFGDLLPDALQLVVGALRSGFSLMQAIDAVVREGPDPVASEFGRAVAETRIGGEIETALENTAERNGSKDLSWLVMAIRIQREVGGNLSEVLETAVETMRERARLFGHVRALSAEGRLSAYVLIGMPISISAWMFAFRGEYLKPLYTEPMGIALLVVACVMVAGGSLWISKLVKVEV